VSEPAPVDAHLVAGGKYHGFDFARLALLKLLAEHTRLRVTVADQEAARGDTDDELYLSEYHEREQLIPLLDTRFRGEAKGCVESDWSRAERQLVCYLRPFGAGAVLCGEIH
jgi:hypothetical protein